VWTREPLLVLALSDHCALIDITLALQAQVLALISANQVLQQRVDALEAQVAQNSGNSSKPPASDGYTKPAPKSLRRKSRLVCGGQSGHPGSTLQAVDKPDVTIVHPLEHCPCGCGAALRCQPVIRLDTRQVFELPPQSFVVTEHQVEVKRCPNTGDEVSAAFPAGINAPTQYGPRFIAWLVYLRVQQLIPLARISQMAADLFGRLISEATVHAAVINAYHALAGFEAKVAELIVQAPIAHADETGLRVAGKLHWLHVASTRIFTWYGISRHRGGDAIRYFGLLPRFTGRLIHDCYSTYFELTCRHGICNAHLLRELTFLHDVLHQKWAKRMLDLLLKMHRSVAACKARDGPSSAPQLAAWIKKYQAILREGFAENPELKPPPGPKRRGRLKRTKAQNLLSRLRLHEPAVLAFMHDSRVPFTNNQAEQDLRMMKVQQKISGAFRTFEGAKVFARVRAYLSTVRKNKRDLFEEIVAALSGKPFMPSIAP